MDELFRPFVDVGQAVDADEPGLAGVLKGARISQDELREWPCREDTIGAVGGVLRIGCVDAAVAADVEAPAFTSGTRIIEPGLAYTDDETVPDDIELANSPDDSSITTDSMSGSGISGKK